MPRPTPLEHDWNRRSGRCPIAVAGWTAACGVALLPLLFDEARVYNAGLVLIFIVAALGLHILVNWAGQLSLAHAGMVGLPALVVATVSETHGISPLYLIPLGVLVGAATGVVVSLPAARATGLQVALVTLTVGIAIDRYFLRQTWLVGSSGLRSAVVPKLGPLSFETSKDLYGLLLAVVALAFVVMWSLMHSKLGRAWRWIAADPSAASAFGIPVSSYKIAAYGAAGGFAGLGGSLMVAWVRQLTAQAFPTTLSFTYLLAAVLAGSGFVGGVALAGLLITGGPLLFSGSSTEVNRVISYAGPAALLMTLTVYKAGLNGVGRSLMEKMGARLQSVDTLPPASDGRTSPIPLESRPASLTIRLTPFIGVVLIAAGFVAITLAWSHASNTSSLSIQNQELISGGVGGLALVVLGVGLLVRNELRRQDETLRRGFIRLEALLSGSSRLESLLSRSSNGEKSGVPTTHGEPVAHDVPSRQ